MATWIAAACLLLALPASSRAQDTDEEDEPLFRPGLVARYTAADGTSCRRVDRRIAFAWDAAPPDRRLPSGKFSVRWEGRMLTQAPGQYRLHVYAAGKVRIKINGKLLLDAAANRPQWLAAEPAELPFGRHPIEIVYQKTDREGRIALFWSGPGFPLEPLAGRWLNHEPADAVDERFERGRLLASAARCGACHTIAGQRAPLSAPALDRLAGNLSRQWLIDWLTQPTGDADHRVADRDRLVRRMPHFALSRRDAEAIVAVLLNGADKTSGRDDKSPLGDAAAGEQLFLTVGCLACHQLGELGDSGLFGGGDLSAVAAKRPADFFDRWLAEPEKINRHRRMPQFRLSDEEQRNLAAYLQTLRPADQATDPVPPGSNDRAATVLGRWLLKRNRCAACHELPDGLNPANTVTTGRLSARSSWRKSCAANATAHDDRPGYRLSLEDQQAVRHFVTAVSRPQDEPQRPVDGAMVLAEHNCLACHARDRSLGIGPKLPTVAAAHTELAGLVPAMSPPSLDSVGDKLHEAALREAIGQTGPVHRPWLAIRMPKFNLSQPELATLVRFFVDTDRIPARPAISPATVDNSALALAGRRLVTTDGFGCTSCHPVGTVEPPPGPLAARGADLSLVGRRIRREWFFRWIHDPARMVPRMEMPSVQLAVHGVLGDRLDDQLQAVWHVLNVPGFEPPRPNPIRVVRQSGVAGPRQRAAVLTDVIEWGQERLIKPLLIGLPNRHNVLIDLSTNQLAGWWLGDVARQRTRGKTWFWETAGTDLLGQDAAGSELTLAAGDGAVRQPVVMGQFVTQFDSLRHTRGGIEFHHRLHFAGSGGKSPEERIVLRVRQTLTGMSTRGRQPAESGFLRRIEIHGTPPDETVNLRIAAGEAVPDPSLGGDQVVRLRGAAPALVRLATPQAGKLTTDSAGVLVTHQSSRAGEAIVFELEYLAKLAIDRFPVAPLAVPPSEAVRLDVVPGFEATRLPLDNELMPTALAWQSDGTLIVASLKGRVWLAHDTDGDGLEETVLPFSDELAAPFGMAAGDDYIDVINKYALLRLLDTDGDGKADHTVTLASGWGHTADYHDWAHGLPRDEAGNYYMALPCQQDQRSPAAAHLRGTMIKLVPRRPSPDDPRQYAIEVISHGHRFPVGIARNRGGALFVSDNQGNYNPFNELNHVIEGAHYGFINALERGGDFQPPLTPPAIGIPHPWTRSVNGICFLYTPPAVRRRLGRDAFGPFEGHLVGCEYDTRRLIRMSLERVGGTYQGAAYPMSIAPVEGAPTLIGPLTCAVAPDGELYVGSIRDSGWGGGQDIGSIARLVPRPEGHPPGIAEVRARRDGFTIDLTSPVDPALAAKRDSYLVWSYRRISTPAYGGDDVDRRAERITAADVSADGRRVRLRLAELREGFVYELRLANLAGPGRRFHPAEAHYTLRKIPE